MAKCPKCGRKLTLFDWKPNCPECGVNLVYYGMEEFPEEWLRLLPKKEWIVELVEKMFERKKEFYV